MFRRILIPLDFTPKNRAAVKAAVRIAGSSKARTLLVHVIEKIDDGDGGAALRRFYAGLERAAAKHLAGVAREFASKRLSVEAVIVFGDRVAEVLRIAAERRIDLLVMSSHRVAARRPTRDWGTISYKVAALARCPVLLVK